jgi:hypothetical protein
VEAMVDRVKARGVRASLGAATFSV